MKRPFEIASGNNVPVHAPLIPTPFVPYQCPDCRHINVYGKADPELIKKYLAQTPFEYLTDDFMILFGNYSNGNAAAFYDASIVIPVTYKGMTGGYYLIEYEDLPSSVVGGRELWGYPKKEGEFKVLQKDDGFTGTVSREGHEILLVDICLDRKPLKPLPEISAYPNLLLWTLPRYDGPGIQSQKVLKRDTSQDLKIAFMKEIYASVQLSGYENPPVIEPLDEWNPLEVYGARYVEGDYFCTDENGWASLVDVIVPDEDSRRGGAYGETV